MNWKPAIKVSDFGWRHAHILIFSYFLSTAKWAAYSHSKSSSMTPLFLTELISLFLSFHYMAARTTAEILLLQRRIQP